MSLEATDERPGPAASPGSLTPLAFTIVTRNHFHLAAGWAEQLRRVDPAARALIVVADADDPLTEQPDWEWLADCHQDWLPVTHTTARCGALALRSARQLVSDNHWRLAFQYSPLELTCCLKGRIAAALWHAGERHLLYTDADTRLYDSVAHCLAPLANSGGILLTPHLQQPLPKDACYPTSVDLLRAGTFNAGVLGWSVGARPAAAQQGNPEGSRATRGADTHGDFNSIESTHEIPAFFRWWNDCTETHCIVEPGLGLFVDQRWLDQAPGLFPSAVISRHLGLNVGYWNLHDRRVYQQENRWWVTADNASTATPDPRIHSQPLQVLAQSDLTRLVQTYLSEWQQHAADHYTRLPYRYDSLTQGETIAPAWRDAYRLNACGLREIERPFVTLAQADGVKRLRAATSPPHLPAGRLQHQIDALHAKIDQLKRKLDRSLWRRWAKAAKQWRHRWWRKP